MISKKAKGWLLFCLEDIAGLFTEKGENYWDIVAT
jgi:hypothetical protein